MDNYFILSSKVANKWDKVAPNMTSVKLGTCIHIVGTYLVLTSPPSFRPSSFPSFLPSFSHDSITIFHSRNQLSLDIHFIVSELVSMATEVGVAG
jgi:hypothetical protein